MIAPHPAATMRGIASNALECASQRALRFDRVRSARRATVARDADARYGSLISETLELMETDEEFQTARRRLDELGQRALTKEERTRRRRALDNLGVPSFEAYLDSKGGEALHRAPTTILQVNIGLFCNQACSHCHVESSPLRTKEVMDAKTAEAIVRVLKNSPGVKTLDLTGGAPELHAQFRYLVIEARKLGVDVIDRCNLTVLYEEGQEDLPKFLADNQVKVVASLPCYSEANTDAQRGKGVFERSIAALKDLNAVGYGVEGTGLELDLMYNPGGAFLSAITGNSRGGVPKRTQRHVGRGIFALIHAHQHADQTIRRLFTSRGKDERVHELACRKLQRRSFRRGDVPRPHQRLVGWKTLRLRFQSTARHARARDEEDDIRFRIVR